jgi:hypothetical protein
LEGDNGESEQLLPKEEETPEEVINAMPRSGLEKIVSKKEQRAWLLLIAQVMLMLSLLGLKVAIRGFASLFRLGSAVHFCLLWCTVLGFIRLLQEGLVGRRGVKILVKSLKT